MSTREERAAERDRYEREEKERRYFSGELIQKDRPKQNFSKNNYNEKSTQDKIFL